MNIKKQYIAPVVSVVELDTSISLVMTSPNTPPNPNDPYGNSPNPAAPQEPESQQNKFKDNPFE